MSSSPTSVLFILFYLVILLFATSDLKRFIFHVHISRVDRIPVEIDIDSSSSLWYPITIGIIFNIFIIKFSIINICLLLWRRKLLCQLNFSTLILLCLFTTRFIINIILTKYRNGLATPTLVERSFFASSLSLEEELTTIILNWIIKTIGFVGTFIYCYKQKQKQTINIERQSETKLMSNFE
ncbi:unnamed protein product [Rotaria sp. Silwood2]|nr:unnamed protein product [Rotaria sp. Silwood2]CAF2684321.1 unnamed protein product [Rotaria sp. Silwood2]CAF3092728.1 unnamed protein product [Rotaria sp. Silwood2]CAF4124217.1 unnamed protein product [Rotaria sp. Silwood2]CAF4134211.1 unnamed protein product [Rotaria sp. Silwood2]